MKKIKLFLITTILSVMPLALAISCGSNSSSKNSDPITPKLQFKDANEIVSYFDIEKTNCDHNNDKKVNFQFKGKVRTKHEFNVLNPDGYAGDDAKSLPKAVYNGLIDVFNEAAGVGNKTDNIATILGYDKNSLSSLIGDKAVAQAIISGDEFHVEITPFTKQDDHEINYLESLDSIQIEEGINTPNMGVWMSRVKFFEKGPNPAWEHGTSRKSNYGILGYPLYFVNTTFAQLGVSGQIVEPHQIYQMTYNHNA